MEMFRRIQLSCNNDFRRIVYTTDVYIYRSIRGFRQRENDRKSYYCCRGFRGHETIVENSMSLDNGDKLTRLFGVPHRVHACMVNRVYICFLGPVSIPD